ncbi:pentapeptide repeat-containing protein [Mucilaginibacter glaciei]|uniref:Pentapeptide repeat-containing protein n=1 Tax=Mucilaginibacter glaciei TaxID=2772109 RepID=A0A926NKK1_9SPHI|nr:pentapeptide repeat-containing protein [Mucilaginibacter glaciei]MBD1393764.1 pentapeptide repeat-containing protein [Mucilaginibacter glaciei]
MDQLNYEDQLFDKENYADNVVRGREFQSCTFRNCDFANSTFTGNKFLDCSFDGCNLSMMKLDQSTLNDVAFKNCKVLGVNFSKCTDFLFSVGFDNCTLDYSSFMGKKMVKTKFANSKLKEVTFADAVLTGSTFNDCDLDNAIFNRTDLGAVNFARAFNFSIDPELNNVKKAIFSSQGLEGLLTRHQLKVV